MQCILMIACAEWPVGHATKMVYGVAVDKRNSIVFVRKSNLEDS